MATHPHGPVNGNGFHGNALSGKLTKLLAYHEQVVASIRAVMTLLHMDAVAEKQNGNGHGVIAQAIALDGARRARGAKPHRSTTVRARREKTARLLAKIEKSAKPVTRDELGISGRGSGPIGILVTRGYLKREGDGYVRTQKPFAP